VAVVVGGDPVGRADVDDEVAVLVVRRHLVRGVEVALGVRGVLQQLAVVVAIALGRLDLRRRLEVQDPLLRRRVRVEPPRRPDRQHEVVAGAVSERTEDRVANAFALVNVEHLVGDAVPVERPGRHGLGRPHDTEHDVVVEVERDPAGDCVTLRRHRSRLRQPVAVEAVVRRDELDPGDGLDPVGLRRRRQVVEDRAAAGETLDAEQLLGVQAAVASPVLGVPLAGQAAMGDVVHRTTGLLESRRPV
jgi:hypothetical protein